MKFAYPLIKKLLPKAPAKGKLVEGLNLHAFETEELPGGALDISLPSNRYSDAASHLGIARETGAIFGAPLKNPVKRIVNAPADRGLLEVKIESPNLCPRYAARYFEIKRIGASPLWLQKILKACGLKPINNIVDLMNYVMLETGQPLHAFDFDKIADQRGLHADKRRKSRRKLASSQRMSALIVVRQAKAGEKIETLDGQKFVLDAKDLVIADSEKALAIAGIKGGANSGVDKNTRRIIVEAANFEASGIFKTSRKLKLITDASVRFSHGLSPALVDFGLDRATELLVKMGAKLVDSADIYPRPVGEEMIEFDIQKYEKLVGAPVSPADAKRWFRALGFSVEPARTAPALSRVEGFMVRVPAWRTDIEAFEDLAEEISRLSGYNRLKPSAPTVSLKPAEEEDIIILKERARQFFLNANFSEIYSYSFAEEDGSAAVELENPVNKELRYLRQSIAQGLLKAARGNSRFFGEVRAFEIGNVFSKQKNSVRETVRLGVLIAGRAPAMLELKELFGELLRGLGLGAFSLVETAPGRELQIKTNGKILGSIRLVHLEKNWLASIGEIGLDALLPLLEETREFKPLPKYPAVVRDISILVSGDVRIGEALQAVQETNPVLIENADLIDEYRDEKFGGRQGLTFRITFQANDRTLTDEEVNKEMEKISAKLKKDFRAEIR